MKKTLNFIGLLILCGTLSGQQIVDNLLKARALKEGGKLDQAISQLNTVISVTKDSRLYLERADVYALKGDYSNAISDYNEANKITPSSGEFGLSRIYALKGDASTSLYHLEMNLKSPFRKVEKAIMLDGAFNVIENRPEWRQFWKKEWYTDIEKVSSEIDYLVSTGKYEEAKSSLDDLKRNYGTSDDIQYAEAVIDLSSGKPAEAVKIISELISGNTENEKYLRLLARSQAASNNPSGASVTYSQLISSGVADAELLTQRAECYMKTGENDKALADINKYLEYYPESRSAISMAGREEAKAGDNLKAIELFTRNLKLHPNDPQCYIDRANAYLVSRSWDWAANDYSMSLDLNPANSDAWLNKGISLVNEGKQDDACHDFRKAFSLGNKRASEYISRYCIK